MSDMNREKDASVGSAPSLRKSLAKVDPIAMAALTLSLVIALINAYYVLRHAEIVVTPPKQVLLFLDGDVESDSATLVAAVLLPMVNTAGQDHGDLLTEASLSFSPGTNFAMESIIEPVFVDVDQETVCELGYRCIRRGQLFIKQDYNAVFDLPGGLASARYASFPVHSFNCTGDVPQCQSFDGLNASVNALPNKSSEIILNLRFVGDGERKVVCQLEGMTEELSKAITDFGWLALHCKDGTVTGAPWL